MATIELSGGVTGSVSLCFAGKVANDISKTFAGTVADNDGLELRDAIGEMANIVVGGAKAAMYDRDLAISLPIVTEVNAVVRTCAKGAAVLVLPCDSPLGRFTVEIQMEPPEGPLSKAAIVANTQVG